MGGKSKPADPVTPPAITVKSLDGISKASGLDANEEARKRAAGTLTEDNASGLGSDVDYSPDVGKPLFG